MSDIKYIEPVNEAEFESSKLLMSLSDVMGGHYPIGCERVSDTYTFTYIDNKGGDHTKDFRILTYGDFKKSTFSWYGDSEALVVKLHYSDGTWGYGIRWVNQELRTGYKKQLQPLYIKIGMVSVTSGDIQDVPYASSKEYILPAWVMRHLPYYNEKMRDSCNGEYNSCDPAIKDNLAVVDAINSDLFTSSSNIKYSVPNGLPKDYGKFAWKQELHPSDKTYIQSRHYISPMKVNSYYITESDDETWTTYRISKKSTFNSNNFDNDFEYDYKLALYSYMKSIYSDGMKNVKAYHVIPISDVLTISKSEKWDSKKVEVWNNLDVTLTMGL